MKTLTATVAACFLLTLAGSAQDSKDSDTAKKLVGVWEVSKSDDELPPGATVEFTKDGKVKVTLKIDEQEIKLEGNYKVTDKNKIQVSVKFGDEQIEETITIKRLTDKDLEIENKEGKMSAFKKIEPKKAEPKKAEPAKKN